MSILLLITVYLNSVIAAFLLLFTLVTFYQKETTNDMKIDTKSKGFILMSISSFVPVWNIISACFMIKDLYEYIKLKEEQEKQNIGLKLF